MTHLIAIVWTVVVVYISVSYMDRKFNASVDVMRDLGGE